MWTYFYFQLIKNPWKVETLYFSVSYRTELLNVYHKEKPLSSDISRHKMKHKSYVLKVGKPWFKKKSLLNNT